jgi:Lrp/AsnC family leucine-responsive transcriptional regulator
VIEMLDSVDLRILRMLARDSRLTLKEIARETGLSISGARRRVRKLQQIGVIEHYSVVIDPKKCGAGLLSFIKVDMNPADIDRLVSKLERRSEVLEIHRVTGENSLLIKARFENMDDLNAFIRDNLSSAEPVRGISTWLVMETYRERPFVP